MPSSPQVFGVHATQFEPSQVLPVPHVPQTPPQPFEPQVLPVQSGVQASQTPCSSSHLKPTEHEPQMPPQPSGPQ